MYSRKNVKKSKKIKLQQQQRRQPPNINKKTYMYGTFGEIKNKIAILIESSCMVFVLCLRFALCMESFLFFSFWFSFANVKMGQRCWLFVDSIFFCRCYCYCSLVAACFFMQLIRCWMTYIISFVAYNFHVFNRTCDYFFPNFSLLMLKKLNFSIYALIYFIINHTDWCVFFTCCSLFSP